MQNNFVVGENTNNGVKIFDILGQEVRTLVNDYQQAGYKSIIWNGDNNSGTSLSSGVYFYKIRVNGFENTKKLVLIK